MYSERVPLIKQKGAVKEEEIFCEDLQVFLNKYRAGKKTTNPSVNSSTTLTNGNANYQSEFSPGSSNLVTETSVNESRLSNSGIKGIKDDLNNGSSLHKKSNTNSNTDFSKFLKTNNTYGTNSQTNLVNEQNISPDKKVSVLENIKKNEASKLMKDEKSGDKSKDLMKKIAALRNKKTQNENK